MIPDAAARAQQYLVASESLDGGWGYAPGRSAVVEPTALCVLALVDAPESRRRGLDWLRATQRADGGWGISPKDSTSSWMTAPAVWALATGLGADHPAVRTGAAWLERTHLALAGPDDTGDPGPRGWAWADTPVPWVEPTALAVLALCAAGRGGTAAVDHGVRFLRARVLAGGGWNNGDPGIGNEVPEPDLHPTALALLALQATAVAGSTEEIVRDGARIVETLADALASPLALGWAVLALARLGVSHRLDQVLAARQRPDGF